jgi:hypothetical protein
MAFIYKSFLSKVFEPYATLYVGFNNLGPYKYREFSRASFKISTDYNANNLVPVFAYQVVKNIIEKKAGPDIAFFPVVENTIGCIEAKSTSTILNLMAANTDARFSKVKLKDHYYYVNRGVLLNENFNIMLIFGYGMGGKTRVDNNFKLYTYINSDIFDSTDPMTKYIASTFIKKIATETFKVRNLDNRIHDTCIIIKKLKDMIWFPKDTAHCPYDQAAVDKLLKDNAKVVFQNSYD